MEDQKSKIDRESLTLLTLEADDDMYLNRLDSVIEYLSQFQIDEDDDYFLEPLMYKLIEARMFYLAWSEGGY